MIFRTAVSLAFAIYVGCSASHGIAATASGEDAIRLVPSTLHVLKPNRARTDAHIASAPSREPDALFFGPVLLVRSKDAGDTHKRVAALASYAKYQAWPMQLELVEDYRSDVGGHHVSACFSQAVNGVRIYNTAACGVIDGADLDFAFRILVRPPAVATRPKLTHDDAWRIVEASASLQRERYSPLPELNVVFLDDKPLLCWRVVMCGDQTTYFVDALQGQIVARTKASYRPTDGSSDAHCMRPT